MNPAFIDDMGWSMAEVYAAVTDQIMINLAHYFPLLKPGQKVPGAFEYQARMLAQMGKVNRETIDIIVNRLGGADAELRKVLTDAIMESLKDEEPKLRKAAQQGLLNGAGFIPPEVTPNQMQAFNTYYRQAADKLNFVNTVMLESTQQAYAATVADITNKITATQSILNVAAGEVVTGVSTFNQAQRKAVARMVQNGLTGFVDHAGRHWSPEAYVAMDIRTTTANVAREAVFERNEEYGNDLYQVSSHDGARPLCYPWQGKIISSSGRAGTTTDFEGTEVTIHSESEIESFRYGGGLFGVNCGHYPMVFIPGFSSLKGEPQSEEANAKTYEESQQQRALERKLREEKRDLEVMKAQGVPEEEIQAQRERVRNASADIDDFCEETGRTRRRDREGAPVRATWPGQNGEEVTRYNGDYIGIDQPLSVPKRTASRYTDTQQQEVNGGAQQQTTEQRPATLQIYDEALEWANESYTAKIEDLRSGWGNVQDQVDAIDSFTSEIPKYEQILKDAVDREDFASRTSSDDVIKILEDGRFKSQIETGASHGYLDAERRKRVTEQLFAGSEPLNIPDGQYEIYGYLGNAPRAGMYGNTRIVFKKENLIDRTTLVVGDSLELLETGADPMATLAKEPKIVSYGDVFSDSIPNAPAQLKNARRDFESIADKGYLSGGNYIELQFHGGVSTQDIEYIEISRQDANKDRIEELAKQRGIKIKWR